ncbi:hypothetical protein TVAG_076610 [Trichomonas vaginalis G3]|uniref:Uncharacterized protein n=1 Tax=Trichomonas vaginalis (strain ATCC PRA-98 / G3) TaxID=412133 RepID=A2D9Q8_TRIV3|nr:hypothetical protein TVAGG3_0292200 [Trichomonas vaginalis G3]EAY22914.1 hypothetical protein TVAG_076610 [Trichomonas vaginalis G3]KAI5527360.1 hypothetical protein TVAGG3_0292200 [Trichomonas vaginalis G3]|eukprot:XP_001583900.1 hypothetical protein [Trichomonas vaginalis G3]
MQHVKKSPSNINYIFDISVCNCGDLKYAIIFQINFGDIRFSNSNITNNKCSLLSSYYSILEGKSGTCNFSTFIENSQTGSESLCFDSYSDSLAQTVSYCNVIGNKCETDNNQVLFSCGYATNVDHCIFLNNTAKYMFYISSGYTLTISCSNVESKSTTGGTVTFFHLNTENCPTGIKDISNKLSYLSKIAKTSAAELIS